MADYITETHPSLRTTIAQIAVGTVKIEAYDLIHFSIGREKGLGVGSYRKRVMTTMTSKSQTFLFDIFQSPMGTL
jgi:hypothetical protein